MSILWNKKNDDQDNKVVFLFSLQGACLALELIVEWYNTSCIDNVLKIKNWVMILVRN